MLPSKSSLHGQRDGAHKSLKAEGKSKDQGGEGGLGQWRAQEPGMRRLSPARFSQRNGLLKGPGQIHTWEPHFPPAPEQGGQVNQMILPLPYVASTRK